MDEIKGTAVKEFHVVAKEYVQIIEQASKQKAGEVFTQMQQALPMVYLKASLLPRPKYCYEDEPKKFVKESEYAKIHDALHQKIELVMGITRMAPGTRPSELEILSFSMAENFTDIYQELKDFIKLYEVGIPQAMNDAVWFCRNSFEQQLGIKLTEGIKLLHQLIFNQTTGRSPAMAEDFNEAGEEENPWFSDDQEEIYGEDE